MELIDKQAALDAVNIADDNGQILTILDVLDVLKALPSTQPEIVRCKDCKWCEGADGLICKNTASWVVATDYDFGCVCGERR